MMKKNSLFFALIVLIFAVLFTSCGPVFNSAYLIKADSPEKQKICRECMNTAQLTTKNILGSWVAMDACLETEPSISFIHGYVETKNPNENSRGLAEEDILNDAVQTGFKYTSAGNDTSKLIHYVFNYSGSNNDFKQVKAPNPDDSRIKIKGDGWIVFEFYENNINYDIWKK